MVEEKGVSIVSLQNVVKTYATGSQALKGVDIDIKKGEFVFLVGASGSGKSTFIRLLLREIEPSEGRIIVNGKDITHLKHKQVATHRRRIGCVFQDFRLLKGRNVFENVAFAQKVIGVPNRLIGQNVHRILALVGLSDKAEALPKELSGGEQQRVAIARALVNRPSILLADEPTGNLDPQNSVEIMQLLEAINSKGTTVIVVTHDHEIVNMMHKRVIRLDKGKIASDEEDGSYQGNSSVKSIEERLTEAGMLQDNSELDEDNWADAIVRVEEKAEYRKEGIFGYRTLEDSMQRNEQNRGE